MNFFDFVTNLSIFSLLISVPLIIRSFYNSKTIDHYRILAGVYFGLVAVAIVLLSFQVQGFAFDIRYAVVILSFGYLGSMAGFITGTFALLTRYYVGVEYLPVTVGWIGVFLCLTWLMRRISHFPPMKRILVLFCGYVFVYVSLIPGVFQILPDEPLLHLQYLLFLALGVIVGGLLIESHDRLCRLIQEKSKVEQELEASERKYRLIAENTSDLIVVINKDEKITYLSPSHRTVLSLDRNLDHEVICDRIHPNDMEMVAAQIQTLFRASDQYDCTFEFRFQVKGQWLFIESKCMAVVGKSGEVENIVVVSRDITERKQAEEYLLKTEKLSVIGELAAGVAHEIRNPLTTIKGFIQLYKSESRYHEFDSLLLEELARIESITSEMLSLGKPQAVHLSQVDMINVLNETLELLIPQARLSNLAFICNYESSSVHVYGEKNQLKQVLLNLVKNAIEAMESASGDIEIEVKQVGNQCKISIRDSGCGIPEELLPRLGEPFYSLKEKGTGLGVMMCHKIIQQHKGTLSYTSEVGEGTKVEVILPIVHAEHSSS